MDIKKCSSIAMLFMALLSAATTQASGYWQEVYSNNYNHFQDAWGSALQNWTISPGDVYLSGDFFGASVNNFLAIKPGQSHLIFRYESSFQPPMSNIPHHSGTTHIGGLWRTQADDIYVVGNFKAGGGDEVLVANPDGRYQTLKGSLSSQHNGWISLQSASNGNIDAGDKLVAGNFDGIGVDEVMLIKANGDHYVMRFNATTANWDIIAQANTGSIHWWKINVNDSYVSGDFNGDGKDDLIAINPNGWHHTMTFTNFRWGYIAGGSNGLLGQWDVGLPDTHYLSADYDRDGDDEILAINNLTGNSHTLNMAQNGAHHFWHTLKHNNSDGTLDTYVNIDRYNAYVNLYMRSQVLSLNTNGTVKIVKY